jgi:hypothetical protein
MEFFTPPPEDPADDWKKGESIPVNGAKPDDAPQFGFSETQHLEEAPLDPNATVELVSDGPYKALVADLNARFKELGFKNYMVKDHEMFMTLFVRLESLLLIERKQFADSVWVVVTHKFLSPKPKQ